MTGFLIRNLRNGLLIEWALASLITVSALYSLWHLWYYSYLPQPFFYEPSDLFADWFNTSYWARDEGSYDVWATLYPPLSFVFLDIFGIDACYPRVRAYDPSAGLAARGCDWLGTVTLFGSFFLSGYVAWRIIRKLNTNIYRAIPRTICVAIGWPMLDALERGNLMLVAFVCFALAFGPILKSARLRWLFAGLAVNFKVYLIASIMPLLFKRKWLWVEGALIATILVYLVSFAILGRGTPIEIVTNLTSWSQLGTASPLDMWFSTTYKAFLALLDGEVFPATLILGSQTVDRLQWILPTLLYSVQATILIAFAFAWYRPEVISHYRLVNLGTMLALITSEAGGYTPAFFTLLIMLEKWKGFGRIYCIVMCYLLAVSFDIPIDQAQPVVRDTAIRNSTVIVTFYVTIGPFIRPALILSIPFALALTTIRAVWLDIRQQGWSERWRFRNDAALLPWIRRPEPPKSA
ncbi:hypothetical protein E3U23_09215 [Erythrobacter litoralis]|uniref:hypothetical protein n=1 Tax=Erythrobacter litoralis TaxID=39960 RepID=UPI0024348110|nr:hypothetical protein [Erythrobacter litoralis]MDG6079371.1 hypothetical protein [Erythrobacter litoralis]